MDGNKIIITRESYDQAVAELEELKNVKRVEIAEIIKEAREQGDLSENAEYDAAKDEQRNIEARIEELEVMIKNSQILDEQSINLEKVHLGCTVKVQHLASGKELVYQIVDSTKIDSIAGKISYESPLGAALLEHEVGDVVEMTAPAGVFEYKIISIEKE